MGKLVTECSSKRIHHGKSTKTAKKIVINGKYVIKKNKKNSDRR